MTDHYTQTYALRNTVVPWMIFWLSALGGMAFAESKGILDHDPTWWRVIRLIIWALVAMQCIHSAIKLHLWFRTFRGQLLHRMAEMQKSFRQLARSQIERRLIETYSLLTVLAAALCLLGFDTLLPFALFFLSLVVVIVLRNFLPPIILYLSSSNPERLALLQTLQFRSFSGVTALLDVSEYLDIEQPLWELSKRAFIESTDARTKDDAAWQHTVSRLMAMAPLLIVDGRDTSEGVLREIEEIFQHGFLRKTMFVSDDAALDGAQVGRCPALETLKAQGRISDDDTFHITEPWLVSSIMSLTFSAPTLRHQLHKSV